MGDAAYLCPLGRKIRLSLFDLTDMGVELLPIPLRTDTEEMQQRVQIAERVDDGRTSQTPPNVGVEIESGLCGSGVSVSDNMSFVQDDSVPHCLEKRS